MSELLPSQSLNEIVDLRSVLNVRQKDRFISRDRLYPVLEGYIAKLGIHPDVNFGINSFLKNKFPNPFFDLAPILEFAAALTVLTGGRNFFKSRSFNYISDNQDVGQVLHQALGNAQFMVGVFGTDFFSRNERSPLKRKTFFKAQIPDSNFYLSVKGGSGAGTFSVDFAIGVHKEHNWENTLGEIWRTGIDTETLADGKRGVRIIRTGGGVRHESAKEAKFEEFKDHFKMPPARALSLMVVNYAQTVDPGRISALSTLGARTLSTLPNTPHSYDYSRLFRHLGFIEEENGLWLEKPADQLIYWLQPGRREKAGYERIQTAVGNLRDFAGEQFPAVLKAA